MQNLEIEALPPERRTKKSLILLGDGCCCCCCCCLHSVGGLAGAVVAARKKRPVAVAEDTPGLGSAPGIYWMTLVVLCALCGGPGVLLGAGPNAVEALEVALIGILMGFPLVQLLAALVAVIIIACLPRTIVAEKRAEIRTIGRIALYTFGGAMAGLIIMIGGFYALTGSGVLR
ncbi:MAG TPA: hypothetical protein VFF73_29445 [Planctomycetota bacterium]|nr:hypothetical protein [Planctomycetota bacterium]